MEGGTRKRDGVERMEGMCKVNARGRIEDGSKNRWWKREGKPVRKEGRNEE